MLDLASTLFFKGKFQIKAMNPQDDLLWRLILKIKNWMVPKWKRKGEQIDENLSKWSSWKFGKHFSSQNDLVHFKSVYHQNSEKMQFWACRIIESSPSQNGCAPREWTTEIGFQQETEKSATISIVIYYSDRPGFIGPCESTPDGSTPRIIDMLVDDSAIQCTTEGYPFDLHPMHLKPGDFPDFWKIVCDENREIPVIYISPRKSDEDPKCCINLIDPERLAKLLGPNALVYYADDLDFSREMTLLCNPSGYGCYSGSICVYAPHPHPNDPNDSYRHRYIKARKILEQESEVYTILRRALAQDVHFYDTMFRMENCKQKNDEAAAEQRKLEYTQSVDELLDDAAQKEQSAREELRKCNREREGFEKEIDELRRKLYNAQSQADSYQQDASQSNDRKKALDAVRHIAKYPKTAQEIAEYFLIHFPDQIAFTEKGKASLQTCKTDPAVLWDALYQIATRLFELYENDNIVSVEKTFNQESNFRVARGEGSMTRKDSSLMRQFEDEYNGKKIDIQAHLKSTENSPSSRRFLRIYFCYDSDIHKIIIGSCGKHLDNYTTRKVK